MHSTTTPVVSIALTGEHYERLLHASTALAGAVDIDAFAQTFLTRSLEFAHAQRACFVLEQEGVWGLVAEARREPFRYQSHGPTPLTDVHEAGLLRVAPILTTIRGRKTRFHREVDEADPSRAQEILCAPLIFDGRVIAVLYLERQAEAYSPLGVQLIARLAQQAAPRLHSLLEMGRLAELIRLRREMTEALRASEERFRSIFNSSPVMIFLTDVEGRLIMINDYWLQAMGYNRVEVVSRTIGEFCTPEGRNLLVRQFQAEDDLAARGGSFAPGLGGNVGSSVGKSAGSTAEANRPPRPNRQYENLPIQFIRRNGAPLDALVSGVVLHSEVEGFSQCLSFAIDMTTHRRAEQELDRYRRRLEELVRERTEELSAANRQLEQDILRRKEAEQALLEAAAVSERHRLARELHDSVTQTLYSISLFVDATRLALTAGQIERAADNLVELRAMSRDAMEYMRALIFELHPPELAEIGLVGALREYLKNYQHRTQIAVEYQITGEERAFPVRTESELYRVSQEALTNSFKHGRADRISVRLHYADAGLDLTIADNGQGFQVELAHLGGGMGIRGMMERIRSIGGQIELESTPNLGTTISVHMVYPRTALVENVGKRETGGALPH